MRKLEFRQFDCFAKTISPNSREDLMVRVLCCCYLNEVKPKGLNDRVHHPQYRIFDTMKYPNAEAADSYPNHRNE